VIKLAKDATPKTKIEDYIRADRAKTCVLIGKNVSENKLMMFWGAPNFDVFRNTIGRITERATEQSTYTNFIFKQIPPDRNTYRLPQKNDACILMLLQHKTFAQSEEFIERLVLNNNKIFSSQIYSLLLCGLVFGAWDTYFLFKVHSLNKLSESVKDIKSILLKRKEYARDGDWEKNSEFNPFYVYYVDKIRWQYWSELLKG